MKLKNEEVEDTDLNGVDTYTITTNSAQDPQWSNQIQGSFTVYSNGVVSSTDFERYASISNRNLINTSIQVIGASSGASVVIPVEITKRSV